MGQSKKSVRATFVVSPDFDGMLNWDVAAKSKKIFTDEDEAKKYAEEILSKGWKRLKTRDPDMPERVNVEVFDVNGHCIDFLSCEPDYTEIVKPAWD